MHLNLSLSKCINLLLLFRGPPKEPTQIVLFFCCLVFTHNLCTRWLGWVVLSNACFMLNLAFGWETNRKARMNTIVMPFTVISHNFQTVASIRVGFALLKGTQNQSEHKSPCTNFLVPTPPLQKCHLSALNPAIHHGWAHFSADIYNGAKRSSHNLWPTEWCFGRLFSAPKPPDSLWWVIYVQELMKKITTCKC